MSVRPSFRMEQLDSHWTDLHEIWYLRVAVRTVLFCALLLLTASIAMMAVLVEEYFSVQHSHISFSSGNVPCSL